jgi:hypothetical protein
MQYSAYFVCYKMIWLRISFYMWYGAYLQELFIEKSFLKVSFMASIIYLIYAIF